MSWLWFEAFCCCCFVVVVVVVVLYMYTSVWLCLFVFLSCLFVCVCVIAVAWLACWLHYLLNMNAVYGLLIFSQRLYIISALYWLIILYLLRWIKLLWEMNPYKCFGMITSIVSSLLWLLTVVITVPFLIAIIVISLMINCRNNGVLPWHAYL